MLNFGLALPQQHQSTAYLSKLCVVQLPSKCSGTLQFQYCNVFWKEEEEKQIQNCYKNNSKGM
jgi:hypothetical protein